MALLPIGFTLLVLISTSIYGLEKESVKKYEKLCERIAAEPYFETDMVVGKPWRIYYTWNLKWENRCLDLVFKNATPMIVQRVWNDMYEYLVQQPPWDAATLCATMGRANHEILLFANQGAAGSFLAVHNVVREGNFSPEKSSLGMLKFHLKLLRQGQFLLLMDCHVGVASLSARPDRPPYFSEIRAATAMLGLGDGFPACVSDINKDDQLLLE